MIFAPSKPLLKLPLDLSSFTEIRKQDYLYVDKTQYAYDLITGGRRFFLSRPRRFGKTLFVSTLREILSGNRELCKGLWIDSSDYPWSKHAVIKLDFSALGIEHSHDLKNSFHAALMRSAKENDVILNSPNEKPEFLLYDLVKVLKKREDRVALLIDEYDSPILRTLKDPQEALKVRDELSSFFAAIKALDAELDFVFITGVSNFAKAGIFSGLNNLRVVSLHEKYAGICGYTEDEMTRYFTDYIQLWAEKEDVAVEELRKKIKTWYNGYRFSSKNETVYNPFSLMNALEAQAFKNFWFQSGTPTFLIEELKKEYRQSEYRTIEFDNISVSEDMLGIFDVGATPLESLMYQTGYLTITDFDRADRRYKLGYPNFEVKTALQKHIFSALAKLTFSSTDLLSEQLKIALNNAEIDKAVDVLKQLFVNIPYPLQVNEEKFYHALLQMACDVAGIKSRSEYMISHGRVDLCLELSRFIYVVEVKLNKSADEALKQIEEMEYYKPFIKEGKSIVLLGLSFHREPKKFDITYAAKRLTQ